MREFRCVIAIQRNQWTGSTYSKLQPTRSAVLWQKAENAAGRDHSPRTCCEMKGLPERISGAAARELGLLPQTIRSSSAFCSRTSRALALSFPKLLLSGAPRGLGLSTQFP